MEAVGQLSPQDWLVHPDTKAVMSALMSPYDGKCATARFAGGCVRDAVLQLPVQDVDIAIDCPPQTTLQILKNAGIKAIPTGIDHGTVTAVMPAYSFEITTLRRDVETDGRHAIVAYTQDWIEDASRRDLTINAMYADLDGAIYDPWNGLADLGARRVRFVGKPEDRINEDVLRLLRFFRFYGRFGSPPADIDALLACRKLAHRIPELSGERVRSEMMRIMAGKDPGGLIVLMAGEGVTQYLFPTEINPGRLRVLAWLESRGVIAPGVEVCPLRRLAALLKSGDVDKDQVTIAELSKAWRLSNAETARLHQCMILPEGMSPVTVGMSQAEARKALYVLGAEAYVDQVLLAWAEYRHLYGVMGPVPGAHGTQCWDALLRLPQTNPPPATFPISGKDVLATGKTPGPQVGHCLRELEDRWIRDDFVTSREALLQQLSEM